MLIFVFEKSQSINNNNNKYFIRIGTDKFRIHKYNHYCTSVGWGGGDPLLKMVQFFFRQRVVKILSFPKGTYYNIKGKCTVRRNMNFGDILKLQEICMYLYSPLPQWIFKVKKSNKFLIRNSMHRNWTKHK